MACFDFAKEVPKARLSAGPSWVVSGGSCLQLWYWDLEAQELISQLGGSLNSSEAESDCFVNLCDVWPCGQQQGQKTGNRGGWGGLSGPLMRT
jgi:hypothetical protein